MSDKEVDAKSGEDAQELNQVRFMNVFGNYFPVILTGEENATWPFGGAYPKLPPPLSPITGATFYRQ